jgi:hypothetical protein
MLLLDLQELLKEEAPTILHCHLAAKVQEQAQVVQVQLGPDLPLPKTILIIVHPQTPIPEVQGEVILALVLQVHLNPPVVVSLVQAGASVNIVFEICIYNEAHTFSFLSFLFCYCFCPK